MPDKCRRCSTHFGALIHIALQQSEDDPRYCNYCYSVKLVENQRDVFKSLLNEHGHLHGCPDSPGRTGQHPAANEYGHVHERLDGIQDAIDRCEDVQRVVNNDG